MKKSYLILLYFVFFVPFSLFYRLFRKPLFTEKPLSLKEYESMDSQVVLMSNESKKHKPSMLVKLLEKIVPTYV